MIEFGLGQKKWDLYEIVIVKLGCTINKPNILRTDDELLLLKEKKHPLQGSEKENDESRIFLEIEDISYIESPRANSEQLTEITRNKESPRNNDKQNLSQTSVSIEEDLIEFDNELGKPPCEDKTEKSVKVDLKEIETQKFESREELKEKVIALWGSKNKMNLNFRTQKRMPVKDNSKISTILCSKKQNLIVNSFLSSKQLKIKNISLSLQIMNITIV